MRLHTGLPTQYVMRVGRGRIAKKMKPPTERLGAGGIGWKQNPSIVYHEVGSVATVAVYARNAVPFRGQFFKLTGALAVACHKARL